MVGVAAGASILALGAVAASAGVFPARGGAGVVGEGGGGGGAGAEKNPAIFFDIIRHFSYIHAYCGIEVSEE